MFKILEYNRYNKVFLRASLRKTSIYYINTVPSEFTNAAALPRPSRLFPTEIDVVS